MTEREHINASLKNSDKNFNENFTHEKEQIMIDGVDVSTCKGLKYKPDGIKKPICLGGGIRGIYRSCLCEKNQNCHFKQLARKTQECEELEKEQNEIKKFLGISHKPIIQRLEELHERSDKYKDKILELEQEYEELKKQLEFVRTHRTVIDAEKDRYRKECEELKKELNSSEKWRIKAESLNEKLDIENTRYRKALEEIEEECNYAPMCDTEFSQRVLDLINKAKGEN